MVSCAVCKPGHWIERLTGGVFIAGSCLAVFVLLQTSVCGQDVSKSKVAVEVLENAVEVRFGDDLFTRYVTNDETKPLFFPVYGPGQVPMTRSFPMAEVEGEADDHPHHKSIWVGHEINGLDFWANRGGVIKFQKIEAVSALGDSFTVLNHWNRRDGGETVLTVSTKFAFGADAAARWIDADVTFQAINEDVTFDDTKEGVFAIRTHSNLRLKPVTKGSPSGQSINSEGVTGKDMWGKPAKWVNYWGSIEDKDVGVAIFDHSSNFRHPCHWHARDYGLIAANPFGLHHFTGAPEGEGAHTIAKGESLTLRYRMLFHTGDHEAAEIETRYEAFVEED